MTRERGGPWRGSAARSGAWVSSTYGQVWGRSLSIAAKTGRSRAPVTRGNSLWLMLLAPRPLAARRACGNLLTATWSPRGGSMTAARARIRRAAARGYELPRIRAVAKRQLQHAELLAQVHFAIRRNERVGRVQPLASGTDDELADPVHGIGDARGRLGREPLVVAHLRVDDQLGVRGVQVVPERLHRRVRGE